MWRLGTAGLAVVGVLAVGVLATPVSGQGPSPRAVQRGGFSPLTLGGPGSEIGTTIRDVEPADASAAKLPAPEGAVVEEVRPGGPAATAGLRAGDVVVEFDGERVRSARQLTRLVRETPPGREVEARVYRDGRRTALRMTPTASGRTSPWFDADALRDSAERLLPGRLRTGRAALGVTTQEMTPELAQFFGATDGVLVTSVVSDSPAARAGIQVGDVITLIAGRSVHDAADLARELRTRERGVAVTVVRDKRPVTLTVSVD